MILPDIDTPQTEAEWQEYVFWHRNEPSMPSEWAMMEVFADMIPSICLEKIAAGEDVGTFGKLLERLRRSRDPKNKVDFLKAKGYPIMRLAEELSGGQVRFHKINCPRGDPTPSLHIYERTNSWWCFAHQHGTDPVDLVVEFTGCTNVEAAKRLTI